MADRVLRGSRLGAVSYETDRNHDLAPRRTVRYACPKDHEFEVPFSDDAEIPPTSHRPLDRRSRAQRSSL